MAFKDTVKGWFKTDDKPTQAQFYSKFDYLRWKDEKIPIEDIDDIEDILDAKADAEALTNLAAKRNIVAQSEMQVFKTREPADEDYVPEQQQGDFCIGIVWDADDNKKWIQGTYLGGDIKAAESYDYDTSVNF